MTRLSLQKFQRGKWKNDPRSKAFDHQAIFGAFPQLPPTLGRTLRPCYDQLMTMECTAFWTAIDQSYIDGVPYSPDAQAAFEGKQMGALIQDRGGCDPNTVMKTRRVIGHLPQELAPYNLAEHGPRTSSDWHLLNESHFNEAAKHVNTGYTKIQETRTSDTFDAIRSALTQSFNVNEQKGGTVGAFGYWQDSWNSETIPLERGVDVGMHCWGFVDFEGDYLIAQNSYGKNIGLNGYHRFPRSVVNREFTRSFTSLKKAVPLTPEQILRLKEESAPGVLQRSIRDIWWWISDHYDRI